MRLIYRATTYERNPDQAPGRPFQQVRESGPAYNLTYRGVTYRIDPNAKPTEVPVPPATYNLIYRGVTYASESNCIWKSYCTHSTRKPSKSRNLVIS